MSNENNQHSRKESEIIAFLKSWMMVLLTAVFVLLYSAALLGWLKPLTDERMIIRLEPIIFVIIGYYFGRSPAQQNEKTLKDEINRQTQRADASQHAKEQAQQTREALEEKIKNVQTVLISSLPNKAVKVAVSGNNKSEKADNDLPSNDSIMAAISILNS